MPMPTLSSISNRLSQENLRVKKPHQYAHFQQNKFEPYLVICLVFF